MNDNNELITEPTDQLERYLDGLMSGQEAKEFRSTVDPKVLEQEEALQSKLDDSLKRMFAFEPLDTEKVAYQASQEHPTANDKATLKTPTQSVDRRHWMKIAIAASMLVAASLGVWYLNSGNGIGPVDNPRSVAMIYQETVARGFDPYYYCEDDERFADTFKFRHGQPLVLNEPEGTRMLGLSYTGGISRNTTAILCEVGDDQVMVFVDVVGHGDLATARVNDDPDLNVFVEEKNGLVFCEVTPQDAPSMMEHLEFVD